MDVLQRQDPLLPGPDDHADLTGRRLGGPLRSKQNDDDYEEYCKLYRRYVRRRAPFWNREIPPRPQMTAEQKDQYEALERVIDKLANCNYVHNLAGPPNTRSVWLYEYPDHIDVVQDVTCAHRMLPTPGRDAREVEQVETHTEYFDEASGVNYVPHLGQVTGPDPAGVSVGVEPPVKRGRGKAKKLCITIAKHPATAERYASMLWAAVAGHRN